MSTDLTSTEERIMETITRTYVSLYEQRVQLVAHALKQNSTLSEKDAADLAVHALYALDHIPEKVR
jgi:ABC-type transport system involved in cytochrome bd biosynthesis fused ATPase/permease subunit